MSPSDPTTASITNTLEQPDASLCDLLRIAVEAINIRPPFLASAVFGRPWTWIPPYKRYSEFKILDLWQLRQTIKFLINVTVPSIPKNPPSFGPPLLNSLFWQPSLVLQRPDHNGSYTSYPDEAWFLINGIMTNDNVAHLNAAHLSYLFHRPMTLIQNSTDSFLIDMVQCMLGKEWQHTTEPVNKAFPAIYDALKSPHKRKVILIAHSQGTIIAANVLRLLYERTLPPPVESDLAEDDFAEEDLALEGFPLPQAAEPVFVYQDEGKIIPEEFEKLSTAELAKLEVYCFATCANDLSYSPYELDNEPLPWLEHFGNEFDIVARLGMQAPSPKTSEIKVEGPRYVHNGAWGHFLNAHYLYDIQEHQKKGRKRKGRDCADPFELVNPDAPHERQGPRLFDYINGGSPPKKSP